MDGVTAGSFAVIMGVVAIVLLFWMIFWFMVPFYIRTMKTSMLNVEKKVTELNTTVKKILEEKKETV